MHANPSLDIKLYGMYAIRSAHAEEETVQARGEGREEAFTGTKLDRIFVGFDVQNRVRENFIVAKLGGC